MKMSGYTEMMVRNRLTDLPLEDSQGNPKKLPDDAVDYLVEIINWAINREVYDALH